VIGYKEKPEKSFLICSGIAVFEPLALDLVPADRPIGISDLVCLALERGSQVTHWTHGAFWMDVNSKEDLTRASAAIAGSRADQSSSGSAS
jgi:NDP-sugar pyrophosphorylase family protein